ncbi:uncharacterized protein H6S33_012063 [Morchella sextelata]|uniref:uncharacterized protein n=1 Tax=Morchella sextelata TaxID=1174677 RepID=UPI001D043F74|nr:uncharacterized protein H6S33_012063 [Morchella sextelata]KAH0610536.1 hypothetical protein H6S33_012063 [Morchella sextelata]
MKSTNIARVSFTKSALSRFTTLLNTPLAGSAAESGKFLSLIKESFRSSLEASTPPVAPTDSHLSRILSTEPFLSSGLTGTSPAAASAASKANIKKFLQDPLELFEEQCLLGKADTELAALCLNRYLRDGLMPEPPASISVPKELKWSAADIVLDGLKRSGVGEPADVLSNPKLARAVAESWAIENKDQMIVRWSKMAGKETLVARQNILFFGLRKILSLRGWESAVAMFMEVLDGHQQDKRFTRREYSGVGAMLCEEGVKGFAKHPSFTKLISKSTVWAVNLQMKAWIHLRFTRRVDVGVLYFKKLADHLSAGEQPALKSWYRQDIKFPVNLTRECLVQGRIEDAEMVKNVVEKIFFHRVTEGHLDEMRRMIEQAKAGGGMGGTGEEASKESENITDLQGMINALG